jgi:hypothetical protein
MKNERAIANLDVRKTIERLTNHVKQIYLKKKIETDEEEIKA